MENPIPSYQRKWLLVDRKKPGFYNPPLLRTIFQYPGPFSCSNYGLPRSSLSFSLAGLKRASNL
ncbi:hypothetical protein X777_07622 [Ooceraea biroi]|uniref:Uncharacterized protein n=1 Tax=Ooceraea biroi TaxID=2015173 RepID=A0A026X3D5_OOCBI|nr:hypothetical protein X777_07622 [Ooceraea biroi]